MNCLANSSVPPEKDGFTPRVRALGRIYVYGLGAAVSITLLALRNRRLLVILMILFVTLYMPAHYAAVAWGQVFPTEFKGLEFLAIQVEPQEPYFYNDGDVQALIFYHNPKLVAGRYVTRQ